MRRLFWGVGTNEKVEDVRSAGTIGAAFTVVLTLILPEDVNVVFVRMRIVPPGFDFSRGKFASPLIRAEQWLLPDTSGVARARLPPSPERFASGFSQAIVYVTYVEYLEGFEITPYFRERVLGDPVRTRLAPCVAETVNDFEHKEAQE